MSGTLYIVATPIGNLEDITLRAVRVLSEAELIAAEDTRRTRKLLNHLGLRKKLISFNRHNAKERSTNIINRLAVHNVALVTDAGTPCISDPGATLVSEAYDKGFNVIAVPGASAITAALSVSGFFANEFLFLGFLPRMNSARREILEDFESYTRTIVIFEAPHRLKSLLSALFQTWGNREIVICRELTKLHEEVFRGTISEASDFFATPRGEFVLIVQGASNNVSHRVADLDDVKEAMQQAKELGLGRKDASQQVSRDLGVPRRQAYEFWETIN